MGMEHLLHITSWYPSTDNDVSGIFVKKHIDAIKKYGDYNNEVWHIASLPSKGIFKLCWEQVDQETYRILAYSLFFKYFKIQTIANLLMILFMVVKRHSFFKHCSKINIHIAPLLLRYVQLLKISIFRGRKIIVTEHWTSYYYHFNLPHDSPRLNSTKNIFKHIDGLITVSQALANDIFRFSGHQISNYRVVPNIIDQAKFRFEPGTRNKQFFMLANWSKIKQPIQIIEAFSSIDFNKYNYKLIIGGKGDQYEAMINICKSLNIFDRVEFKGWLTTDQVAAEMRISSCFLHNSDYETFSVVTAEALCAGTPVLVRSIPAIEEFVNASNGIFVNSNETKDWLKGLTDFLEESNFDNQAISKSASKKFSIETIANNYVNYINLF
jgi:glycosyltransferase involved in cell wall biosynthesis